MASTKILQTGDPTLTTKAFPVRATGVKNKNIQGIINTLIKILQKEHLTSISAPQVGESKRIIAIQHIPKRGSFRTDKIPRTIIVNPVILNKTEKKELDWERCKSVADGNLYALVPRSTSIELIGFDRYGKKLNIRARGFKARVIQHAIDHLEGRVFLEQVKPVDMRNLASKNEWEKHHRKKWKKPQHVK